MTKLGIDASDSKAELLELTIDGIFAGDLQSEQVRKFLLFISMWG